MKVIVSLQLHDEEGYHYQKLLVYGVGYCCHSELAPAVAEVYQMVIEKFYEED